jgi:hypothetical protein
MVATAIVITALSAILCALSEMNIRQSHARRGTTLTILIIGCR